MRRLFPLTSIALATLALSTVAHADTIADPLHFSCSLCSIDNSTVTPSNGVPTGITGFASPPNSGDLTLLVLIPNNDALPTLDVTGTVNGSSFSGTMSEFISSSSQGAQWTTGTLEGDFMGITNFHNGSPPNMISSWLPSTQGVDSGANGYFLETLDIGTVSLNTPGGSSPISLDLSALPLGGLVLGDLSTTSGVITTAQSAALFNNGPGTGINTQLGAPGPVLGAGLLPGLMLAGVGLFLWRRRFGSLNRVAFF